MTTVNEGEAERTGPEITRRRNRQTNSRAGNRVRNLWIGSGSFVVGGIMTTTVLKGARRDLLVTFCPFTDMLCVNFVSYLHLRADFQKLFPLLGRHHPLIASLNFLMAV